MAEGNDWLDLCDEIDNGGWDGGLDEIARAVASRRDIVARRNARRLLRSLSIGDRVVLTNGIKPRYLEGMTGSVVDLKLDQGAAVVTLDKTPSHTGAGRPPAEGFKKKLLVPLINLVKHDGTTQLSEVDEGADIGDDSDDMEEIDDDD